MWGYTKEEGKFFPNFHHASTEGPSDAKNTTGDGGIGVQRHIDPILPYGEGKPFSVGASELQFAPKTDTGWDVQATKIRSTARRNAALNSTNGRLHDGHFIVDFFVLGVSQDLSLAGTTAQSAHVRDFYAHNVNIPSLKVLGQCLDQNDYALMCEFVHQAQIKAVKQGQLTQIDIAAGGSNKTRKIIKGRHKPISAHGYIKAMPRIYERWINVPTFSFEFVIARMDEGIYQEVSAENPAAANFIQILQGLEASVKPATPQKEPAPVEPNLTKEQEDHRNAAFGPAPGEGPTDPFAANPFFE